MQESFFIRLKSYLTPIILESWTSPISNEQYVLDFYRGQFRLSSSTATQSFGKYYHAFDFPFKQVGLRGQKLQNVLILGCGLGSILHVLKANGNTVANVDIVELDPSILEHALKHQTFPKEMQYEMIKADAWEWVGKNAVRKKYDLICVDLYIDQTPVLPLENSLVNKLEQMLVEGGKLFWSFPDGEEKMIEIANSFDKFPIKIEGPTNQILFVE